MNFRQSYHHFLAFCCFAILISCETDTPGMKDEGDLTHISYAPESYTLIIPSHFPQLDIPSDNPLTKNGVQLGRHLFYDPILSSDSTISCSSCHLQEGNFTDNTVFSKGVDGALGHRNSMSLLNVAYGNKGFFWDGRARTLEDQVLIPVEDINEMANSWETVVERMMDHEDYPEMFRKSFGIKNKNEITKELITKAIAQFERIMISNGMSKFDRVEAGLDVYTDQELLGRDLFFDENPDVPDAECNHCHSIPLTTSNAFFNNGLDEAPNLTEFSDLGLGKITGKISDNGKFKAPSLRNIAFSAPYMHDGRFSSIEEVVEHYNSGGKNSPNKDPLIRPLGLTMEYKNALISFIKTMEEPEIIEDSKFSNPF